MSSITSGVTTVTGSILRLNQYLTNNNILGFAVKNNRDRFLIPSNQNSYNDIQIEYILIDSGSNSSLLPLPMTPEKTFDIYRLIQNFPFDRYTESFGAAHGIDPIHDTTLNIKPLEDNGLSSTKIKCSLHSDSNKLELELPYIRFSLDRQSMKILAETDIVPFSETDKETKKDALKFLDDFINYFSLMVNNKKRDYCFLGQQFLRNVGSIQLNEVIIFIDKQKLQEKLFPPINKSVNEIANFLLNQRPIFAKTERFLFCEDNDHGGKDLLNISNEQIGVDEHYKL
ncbi:unnamed protein product [Rotaria sp. Silwood1]|nr:unnamed protein product [Rotaria sp. Silwood1]CAF4908283.1 unnamed protein product [Rotaria sp. Silwood1]